jgi:hypothetical protein
MRERGRRHRRRRPKCCKSFLALDLAVAVASGAPCVRRFSVARTGRVLLFATEDALHIVRQRLAGIARAAGRDLADLDIQVITAPSVRLDVERDRDALTDTVTKLRPTLLVLSIRSCACTASTRTSPGRSHRYSRILRELQRRYHVAVVLVHHARKGDATMRAGQALRGSSEFHAWSDSNLYLRRHGDQLTLSVEHRAAPSISTVSLHLDIADQTVALAAIDRAPAALVTTTPPRSPPSSASLPNSKSPMRRFRRRRFASAARSGTAPSRPRSPYSSPTASSARSAPGTPSRADSRFRFPRSLGACGNGNRNTLIYCAHNAIKERAHAHAQPGLAIDRLRHESSWIEGLSPLI